MKKGKFSSSNVLIDQLLARQLDGAPALPVVSTAAQVLQWVCPPWQVLAISVTQPSERADLSRTVDNIVRLMEAMVLYHQIQLVNEFQRSGQ